MRSKTILATMLGSLVVVLALATTALASHGAKGPSAIFVTPKASAKTSSTVSVNVKLKNFAIDAKNVGKMNKAGRGHLHFSLDNGKFDYPKYSGANGKLAAQLGIAGKYSPAVTPSITYRNLPKGEHTLTVFLVNNDHSNNGAKSTVTFWVK
jgi:hypothetical protein